MLQGRQGGADFSVQLHLKPETWFSCADTLINWTWNISHPLESPLSKHRQPVENQKETRWCLYTLTNYTWTTSHPSEPPLSKHRGHIWTGTIWLIRLEDTKCKFVIGWQFHVTNTNQQLSMLFSVGGICTILCVSCRISLAEGHGTSSISWSTRNIVPAISVVPWLHNPMLYTWDHPVPYLL